MNGLRRRQRLTRAKRLLRASAAAAILAVPVALAQSQSQNAKPLPRFEVASVKPREPDERYAGPWQHDNGYWAARKTTVLSVIVNAFGVSLNNIGGIPAWARQAHYDMQAHMPPDTSEAQSRLMLQSLLANRFQLVAHQAMRPMEVSILTAGPPGPDLHPASRSCVSLPQARNVSQRPSGTFGFVQLSSKVMELAGCSVSMAAVADFFTMAAIHPVVDETGLKGLYDIDVTVRVPALFAGESPDSRMRSGELALDAAFHKQLGLEINYAKTVKRPMPVLVIDRLAPASAN